MKTFNELIETNNDFAELFKLSELNINNQKKIKKQIKTQEQIKNIEQIKRDYKIISIKEVGTVGRIRMYEPEGTYFTLYKNGRIFYNYSKKFKLAVKELFYK